MDLKQLLAVPAKERDMAWTSEFFRVFPQSKLSLFKEESAPGPDGFSYAWVQIDPVKGGEIPALDMISWAAQKNLGLVVNPNQEFPDYVFTFGMLWNFVTHGRFADLSRSNDLSTSQHANVNSPVLMKGPPNPEFLPPWVRQSIKDFLTENGFLTPKWQVVSLKEKHFDFVFSQESFRLSQPEELKTMAEALSWFFPPEIGVIFASEKELAGFDWV